MCITFHVKANLKEIKVSCEMFSKKRQFGNLGEDIAVKYLLNKGFSVLHRNYLRPFGEIDIVACKAGSIRFVEVKSVSREMLDDVIREKREDWNPAELVHPKKIQRMLRAIEAYLIEFKVEMDWQIDVMVVKIDQGRKIAAVEVIEAVS